MRNQFVPLLYVLLTCGMGCVFISEPDVGASDSNGPFFGDDYDGTDPLGGEPGQLPPNREGDDPTDLEMNGEASANNGLDSGVSNSEDATQAAPVDAEVGQSEDASGPMDAGDDDIGTTLETDGDITAADVGVSDNPDMGDLPNSACNTRGCDDFGYCDDENQPECWIGDQPACYPFDTPETTNLEAYARCCGHLGSCGPAGQWCEPNAPAVCWLSGNQAQCYLDASAPLSRYLCEGRSR